MTDQIRPCPLCGETRFKSSYPWAIEFDREHYFYYRCIACLSVFVDPVPDESTFAKIYAKTVYHDTHYSENKSVHYRSAVSLLERFAPPGSSVLDYGCGFGQFLAQVQAAGFQGTGVELDADAAGVASSNAGCKVLTVADFHQQLSNARYEVLHLGDVLEHLPEPAAELTQLLQYLKPGGLLFVEGPLEVNPSPVYFASRMFGVIKRSLRPDFIGKGKPTHLFRTGGNQQMAFFKRVAPSLEQLHWEIYETGWPYAEGGVAKRLVAKTAMLLGGHKLCGVTFGNRFTGLFRFKGR
jgi:SAM-dependent methyltransferase